MFLPLVFSCVLDWKCNWFCLFCSKLQFCAYVSAIMFRQICTPTWLAHRNTTAVCWKIDGWYNLWARVMHRGKAQHLCKQLRLFWTRGSNASIDQHFTFPKCTNCIWDPLSFSEIHSNVDPQGLSTLKIYQHHCQDILE